jgi:hypothetical protein
VDILQEVLGGTDSAAVFGVNVAPTQTEIALAQRDAEIYGEAVNRLVAKLGLRPGEYARNQPIFGPLVRLMALAGWTLSGSGFFSVCFYRGGLAIKLSLRGAGDAAIAYAHWAKDNNDVAGVPMVYAIGEWSHCAAVLMERYEQVGHLIDPDSDHYDPAFGYEFDAIKASLEQGIEGDPAFTTSSTALTIRNQFAGVGQYDMHYDNVMQDRKGNIIITDPLGRSRDNCTRYGGYYSGYEYYNDNYSQAA